MPLRYSTTLPGSIYYAHILTGIRVLTFRSYLLSGGVGRGIRRLLRHAATSGLLIPKDLSQPDDDSEGHVFVVFGESRDYYEFLVACGGIYP